MNQDAYDLIALGAAGALSDDEYRTLEELLATDPALAAEHRELQMSAAVLAEASSEPPPPALRAAVLDAIRNVEQVPAVVESTPSAPTNETLATVVPIHRRRWMIPATAAAAVVMLMFGGLLINQFADAPSDDRVAAVLDDDESVTIDLTGSLEGLSLVHSEEVDASVLVGDGVTVLDDELVYQLWAIRDADVVGLATFTPAETGEVALLVDGTGPDGVQFAVTVEPEGGSDQPTSDPIAVSPPPRL